MGSLDLILANKIDTIKYVNTFDKCQSRTDHRIVRVKVVLDLKLERLKVTRKPTTSGINNNNLIEDSDQYQKTPNEQFDTTNMVKKIKIT